jgi:hypothetical protein
MSLHYIETIENMSKATAQKAWMRFAEAAQVITGITPVYGESSKESFSIWMFGYLSGVSESKDFHSKQG